MGKSEACHFRVAYKLTNPRSHHHEAGGRGDPEIKKLVVILVSGKEEYEIRGVSLNIMFRYDTSSQITGLNHGLRLFKF